MLHDPWLFGRLILGLRLLSYGFSVKHLGFYRVAQSVAFGHGTSQDSLTTVQTREPVRIGPPEGGARSESKKPYLS